MSIRATTSTVFPAYLRAGELETKNSDYYTVSISKILRHCFEVGSHVSQLYISLAMENRGGGGGGGE